MISHIKLHDHKGLKLAKLEDLEQFNVICGRNNSGKTTLLESIAQEKTRTLGTRIPESEAERLAPLAASGMGWGSADKTSLENRTFKRILSEFLRERADAVVYFDEVDMLVDEMRNRANVSTLRNWAFADASVKNAFQSCFAPSSNVVYVPPERTVEIQVPVNGTQQLNSNGYGTVNYLFRAKNLPANTIEHKCWDTVADAFQEISGGCRFDIFMPEATNLRLNFADPGRDWIGAESCGRGLQDLLIILTHSLLPGRSVIVLEEPETHMHPDLQRRLAIYLKSIPNLQFIVSTHSNVFLNSALVNKVFLVSYDAEVRVVDATSRAFALDALGYQISDNLVSDLVILMEGPTDRHALEQLLIKRGVMPKKNIKFWPLGGDIMDQLDLEVLSQGTMLLAVVDQDPGSASVRNRFIENCKRHQIPVRRLERYGIENYFPIETYRRVFGSQVPAGLEAISPELKVERQLGFSPKKKLWNLATEVDMRTIAGTDLGSLLDQIVELSGA